MVHLNAHCNIGNPYMIFFFYSIIPFLIFHYKSFWNNCTGKPQTVLDFKDP